MDVPVGSESGWRQWDVYNLAWSDRLVWSRAPTWKVGNCSNVVRGFESLSLRHVFPYRVRDFQKLTP